MIAFVGVLFVLLTIFYVTQPQKDGFSPVLPPTVPPTAPPTPAQVQIAKQNASRSSDSEESASSPPHSLPVAPYEQIAATSPLPYQDTSQIKANRQQLLSALEMVKGFLAFEAQEIADSSDPSIQLPLSTVRSDFHTLQSEVSVLNRNPGIQPTITQSHLNDISSNLAYLQEKVRLLGHAGALRGPVNLFSDSEGFQNKGDVASLPDLMNFVSRVEGEIIRLSASGTTDPVIQARVTSLTKMKQDVKEIVDQLKSGALLSTEVPIMRADLETAFPVLGNPSKPLPQLIKRLHLPQGLANLLPNDPETTRGLSNLLDGITATFEVKYIPQKSEKERKKASTLETTGFPSAADLENVSQAKFIPQAPSTVTDKEARQPHQEGRIRPPATFDWRERAKQIEDQIRKRGLNPQDFGVMPPRTTVSSDFSWKGYTAMMCNRLQATMDPSLPETCGCPRSILPS